MERKTSKEWYDLIPDEYGLKILDPDGWDRENFQISFYEELITREEFKNRISLSTIQCKKINFLDDVTYKGSSLNGHTIEDIKAEISKSTGYDPSNIRLFGSRITGGWNDHSDLDVAIMDENKVHLCLSSVNYLGLNCEIRFVEDFEVSWLKDSV